MPRNIPWGRLLAEAVVVVASILLAFAIDAGWDRHQLIQEEREVLGGLESELEEGRLVIEATRVATTEARAHLHFFLEATPDDIAGIPASAVLERIYYPLIRQWGSAIPRGALDAATGSGQLAGIREPALRAALARLGSHHAQVADIYRLIGDLDIRTAAVLGEFDGMYSDPSGDPAVDAATLRAIRGDPRVQGAASAKYGFVGGYLGILSELEQVMDETLAMIREAAGS
jgi:hypothetical protein